MNNSKFPLKINHHQIKNAKCLAKPNLKYLVESNSNTETLSITEDITDEEFDV